MAKEWTKDEVEQVRMLAEIDGLSASQIGRRIGRTRNMVMGKMHREGIHSLNRPEDVRGARGLHMRSGSRTKRDGRKPVAAPVHAVFPPAAIVEQPVATALPQPLKEARGSVFPPEAPRLRPLPGSVHQAVIELRDGECRWPIGEGKEFHFCLAPQEPYLPYCKFHVDKSRPRP